MAKNILLVAGTVTLAAGTAVAADATFENHLQSAPMVSPAQLYQIEELRTDFGLGFSSTEDSDKVKGSDELKDSTSGTGVFAAGVYNVKSIGLRAGMSVNYGSGSTESDTSVTTGTTTSIEKVKYDGSMMTFTPQAAMPLGPVVAGVAIDVNQESVKPEEGDELKATYQTYRPGVLFANKDMEAGVTYSTRNKIKAEASDELPVNDPSKLTIHGRYALSSDMAAGGIVRTENWQGIDEDAYKARTTVKGTFEWAASPMKVEGDLGYNTAFYKEKDTGLSSSTIGTWELGAAAGYSINKDANVGGALAYEFGSDKNDTVEVANNALGFAVRGNMKF